MSTNYLTNQQASPNFEKLFPLYELQPTTPEKSLEGETSYESLRGLVDYEAIEARAWQLIAEHSRPEKQLAFNEAEDNARTALFEALTESGHLSRIEPQGDIVLVHVQIVERLLNGYDPELPGHELWRRFKELCEELAAQEVFRKVEAGELPPSIQINTISDFPVSLGESANKLGYRYDNKKGMVRSTFIERDENGNYRRIIEQMSRSNSDPYESVMALHDMGVAVKRAREVDIDLLGTQFMNPVSEAEKGVVGLMRRLDSFSGPNIRYGEVGGMDTVSYEHVARVSRERERRVDQFVKRLASCEKELDELERSGAITRGQWLRQYREEVRECVRQICIINPEYTEKVLGGGAVKEAYMKAHEQFMAGDTSGAAETIGSVSSQENSIVICGGEVNSAPEANDPNSSNDALKKRVQDRKNAKENWQWKKGYCRVELCAFRRKETKVGPCDVCATCQAYFDDDKDPSTEYRKRQLAEVREAMQAAPLATKSETAVNKNDLIKERYGSFAQAKIKFTIGGAEEVIVDRRNGFELAA